MGEGKVGENRLDSIIPAEQICVLHCSVCHLGNNKSKEIQEIIPSEQINVLNCSFGFQQNTKKVPPNCLPSPHRGWALCLLGCPLCRRCTPRCNTESNIIRKLILITRYPDQMFKSSKRPKTDQDRRGRPRLLLLWLSINFESWEKMWIFKKLWQKVEKWGRHFRSLWITLDHLGSLEISCHVTIIRWSLRVGQSEGQGQCTDQTWVLGPTKKCNTITHSPLKRLNNNYTLFAHVWMTQITAWLHSWTSGLWTHYAWIHHSNALDLPNFISGSFEHYIEDCYIQIIGKGNLVDGNVCQPVVQIRVWSSLSQVQQILPWDNSLLRNGI